MNKRGFFFFFKSYLITLEAVISVAVLDAGVDHRTKKDGGTRAYCIETQASCVVE